MLGQMLWATWSTMENDVPFSVREFRNPAGSLSWRVDGYSEGKRIRKNFADQMEAINFCEQKNIKAITGTVGLRILQTRLSKSILAEAEACVARIDDRWSLSAVVEAGLKALTERPVSVAVGPLLEEWLLLVAGEVSRPRLKELRNCCRRFVVAKPAITTSELTAQVLREYIDGTVWLAATKRNNRNSLHRFFDWLVERGYLLANPASGVRVRRRHGVQGLPRIFSPEQAAAVMRATELPEARRFKGWMALGLFCGLRPTEAERLTWGEISLEAAELTVLGQKRGAKPRVVPLTPQAVAWLQAVKADGETQPGYYRRRGFQDAVDAANKLLSAESKFAWDEDILRHSYASYASGGGVAMGELAERMGNSIRTIYSHYRHPVNAAAVKAFMEIRPS